MAGGRLTALLRVALRGGILIVFLILFHRIISA
jgi:hypothetical protein